MRIALLTDGIQPYVMGGMQKHSFYIAKYLALSRVEVDLYHTTAGPDSNIEKLEVFTAEERKMIHSIVVPFPTSIKIPGHYIRNSHRYSELLYEELCKRPPVDFIYVKGLSGWKLMEEKSKGKSFPPIGVKFHGMNMFQKPPSRKGHLEQFLFRGPVRFNMRHADYVFSYGGKITEIIHQQGIARDKIIDLPTGIEAARIAASVTEHHQPLKFLYIGRYERLKGVEELSKAIEELSSSLSFEFHFVGPIPEHLRVQSDRVKYWGKISDPNEMLKVVQGCDVLLCPSYSEGMPNVIIEAMAQGLAIIATDVGAVQCLVSEKNGWLIEQCTVQGIKQAMEEAVAKKEAELTQLKKYSLEKTGQELVWENIAVQLKEILTTLVK